MRLRRAVIVAMVLGFATAHTATAQEENRLAIGGSVGHRAAIDADTHGQWTFGLNWRLGHGDSGWGWQSGLGWYSADLDRTIGGRSMAFGELKVRPVLVGYGYRWNVGKRTSIIADALAGAAFTSFEPNSEALNALYPGAAQNVEINSGFIPVLKPELSLWFDLNRRFGISIDTSYTIARPGLTIVTPAGRDSMRVRADVLSVSGGLVYRIF